MCECAFMVKMGRTVRHIETDVDVFMVEHAVGILRNFLSVIIIYQRSAQSLSITSIFGYHALLTVKLAGAD